MAHLQLRRAGIGRACCRFTIIDNYVTLLPGESRTISVEASEKDLAGQQPLVVLDGWNVTTKGSTFSKGLLYILSSEHCDESEMPELKSVPTGRLDG